MQLYIIVAQLDARRPKRLPTGKATNFWAQASYQGKANNSKFQNITYIVERSPIVPHV